MSTIEIGDGFRDQVAELLRASGRNVVTEILIGHKRVDITFDVYNFGRRRSYAVEAKNWAKALSKTDLETIYGGYASILAARNVDELLIVAPKALTSPQAKAFIRDTPQISFLSFNEFQESLLGFRTYLQNYISSHDRNGLEDYYVSPMVEEKGNLLDLVDAWLSKDDANPLAIIASYGMGKTSFAEHITYQLAKRFLAGDAGRVPILLRLGAISREQSIEGLIGSVLAGGIPSVEQYSYPLFSRLNAIGRFVVLLDGFDEMKHMMTYSDFVTNFEELNKLVDGSSKVILLGRPTAFLSENERESVLRGTRPIGKTRVRAPGAPTYQEINLCPFTPPQLKSFVTSYLRRSNRLIKNAMSEDLLAKRVAAIVDPSNKELLSRPIHARMMADLATDPDFDMTTLSRFALYDHFIDFLIKRELAKPGRGVLYKANDRRAFATDLAWHLWTQQTSTGLGCRFDDLPNDLFGPYIPQGEDLNSAKRDLLQGSFLDEKSGGVFFFTHKSFQEFLVAEYIYDFVFEANDDSGEHVETVVAHMTNEVFDFLIEQDDEKFFREFASTLTRSKGGFQLQGIATLCQSKRMYDLALQRTGASFSSWDAVILLGRTIIGEADKRKQELIRVAKVVAERSERKPMVLLAGINTLIVLGIKRNIPIAELILPTMLLLFARARLDLNELAKPVERQTRADALRDLILYTVSARWTGQQRALLMQLDVDELIVNLAKQTSYPSNAAELESYNHGVVEIPFNEVASELSADDNRIFKDFYERDADLARSMQSRPNRLRKT